MSLEDSIIMIDHRMEKEVVSSSVGIRERPFAHIINSIDKKGIAAVDGGTCYGFGDASLTHQKLRNAAQEVDDLFDFNHTVIASIIAFDCGYLSEQGIILGATGYIDQVERSVYTGEITIPDIDLMELRLAVMAGLMELEGTFFEDMRYVASIEATRSYVYAHIIMADAGFGVSDTRGNVPTTLQPRDRDCVRSGIDRWLNREQLRLYANAVHS